MARGGSRLSEGSSRHHLNRTRNEEVDLRRVKGSVR